MSKISDLNSANLPLQGNEQFVLVQNGETVRTNGEDVETMLGSIDDTRTEVSNALDEIREARVSIEQNTRNLTDSSGSLFNEKPDLIDVIQYDTRLDTNNGNFWKKVHGRSWQTEIRSSGKYLGIYNGNSSAITANPDAVNGDYYYWSNGNIFREFTDIDNGIVEERFRFGKENFPQQTMLLIYERDIIIMDNDGATPTPWMFIRDTNLPGVTGTFWNVARFPETADIQNGVLVLGFSTGNGQNAEGLLIFDFLDDQKFKLRTSTSSTRGLAISGTDDDVLPKEWILSNYLLNHNILKVKLFTHPDGIPDRYGRVLPTLYAANISGLDEIRFGTSIAQAQVYNKIIGNNIINSIDVTRDYVVTASNTTLSVFKHYNANDLNINSRAYFLNVVSEPFLRLGNINNIRIENENTVVIAATTGVTRVQLADTREECIVDNIDDDGITYGSNGYTKVNINSSATLPNTTTSAFPNNGGTVDVNIVGTINSLEVAPGAELHGFSQFSRTDYLEGTLDSPIGTQDFMVEMWINSSQFGNELFTIGDVTTTNPSDTFHCYKNGANGDIAIVDAATFRNTGTSIPNTNNHIVIRRKNGILNIFKNGDLDYTVASTSNLTNPYFRVGAGFFGPLNSVDSFLTFKIDVGKTPTITEIKESYDRSKSLFIQNAKCLLSPSRNTVTDVDVDKINGITLVSQPNGINSTTHTVTGFSDLNVVKQIIPTTAENNIWSNRLVNFISVSDTTTLLGSNVETNGGVLYFKNEIETKPNLLGILDTRERKLNDLGTFTSNTNTTNAIRLYGYKIAEGHSPSLKIDILVFDELGNTVAKFYMEIDSGFNDENELVLFNETNEERFNNGSVAVATVLDPTLNQITLIANGGTTDLLTWKTTVSRI